MTGEKGLEQALTFTSGAGGEASGDALSDALSAEVAARFGPRDEAPLSIRVYDESGALVAGLNGATHWRWFYIRQFWVAAGWRAKGVGRRLLARAEAEARAKNCVGLYLDTFDPGAARFYERCGFRGVGRIEDFPPGHARTFLCKRLG